MLMDDLSRPGLQVKTAAVTPATQEAAPTSVLGVVVPLTDVVQCPKCHVKLLNRACDRSLPGALVPDKIPLAQNPASRRSGSPEVGRERLKAFGGRKRLCQQYLKIRRKTTNRNCQLLDLKQMKSKAPVHKAHRIQSKESQEVSSINRFQDFQYYQDDLRLTFVAPESTVTDPETNDE